MGKKLKDVESQINIVATVETIQKIADVEDQVSHVCEKLENECNSDLDRLLPFKTTIFLDRFINNRTGRKKVLTFYEGPSFIKNYFSCIVIALLDKETEDLVLVKDHFGEEGSFIDDDFVVFCTLSTTKGLLTSLSLSEIEIAIRKTLNSLVEDFIDVQNGHY
ncbi:hypothetical protein [Enterococcus sp.]|uniref:hypothetical protein n=1 Tax=Enterococcus sp. TaxID=35783 RepID=UPI003C783171